MTATATRIPDDVLDRVRAAHDLVEVIGREVPLTRRGASFKGACPFHEDGTPSFDVNPEKQTFKCFGCEAQGDVIAWTMKRRAVPFREAVRVLAEEKGIALAEAAHAENGAARPGRVQPTRTWTIRDAEGNAVAEHERIDYVDADGKPRKRFLWRHNGVSGLGGVVCADVPLYGSEHLRALPDEVVVVAEGEKAADALAARGILALGTVTGASSCPSAAALEVLRGRRVVLWPDADAPGRRHMTRLGSLLAPIAASVRVATDPNANDGDDAADLDGYGDDVVRGILGDAVPFPGPLAAPATAGTASAAQGAPAAVQAGVAPAEDAPLPFRTLRKVAEDVASNPPPPPYWMGFLGAGKVGVVAGLPKSGKTEVAFAFAAAMTRGTEWLGVQLEAADVVVVTEEGDADLVAKLSRFGANIDRVHVLNPDGGAGVPTFGELVSACGDLAARTGARLVLLDTFAAWGGLSGDEERSEGVVGPLVRMLRPLKAAGLAVLLLHHLVKNPEADGVAAVRGSGALVAEVESFAVFREPGKGDSEARRIMKVWSRTWGRSSRTIERMTPPDGDAYYRVLSDAPARDAKVEEFRASDRKVLDALAKLGGWIPKRALLEATGLADRTLDGALSGLFAADRILRRGRGVNGDPLMYARLGTPARATEPNPAETTQERGNCAPGAADGDGNPATPQLPLGSAGVAAGFHAPRTTRQSASRTRATAAGFAGGEGEATA